VTPETVALRCGGLAAEIVPGMGGGLARFEYNGVPLFRPWAEGADPFGLASILLVPWSNRISGGGFTFEGTFHPLAPNVAGERFPIHGNGFQQGWTLANRRDDAVELVLSSDGPGPFRYQARADYALDANGLDMRLEVTNRATIRLPFGLGFHPWLVRTPHTTLRASLPRVWLETSDHLPDKLLPVEAAPHWDFRAGRPLPPGWINNGFPGWDGRAAISWPELGLTMRIDAAPALSCAILYSPGETADFFCLEPVNHAVDTFNAPGGAQENGPPILAPGETETVWCRFAVEADAAGP
jgi:aldose 1-epimerase